VTSARTGGTSSFQHGMREATRRWIGPSGEVTAHAAFGAFLACVRHPASHHGSPNVLAVGAPDTLTEGSCTRLHGEPSANPD
jgi:hypothetical protein